MKNFIKIIQYLFLFDSRQIDSLCNEHSRPTLRGGLPTRQKKTVGEREISDSASELADLIEN